MLMELDVAAVDMPQSAFGLLSEPGQQCIPEAAEAPPAELRVDRAPKPKFGWQFTPRRACAQDEKKLRDAQPLLWFFACVARSRF